MIIEQIDNSKVLIVLGGNDMKDFSLEYEKLSFDDPHSKKILKRLLTLACNKAGLNIADKKILVEAMPQENGCLILLTLVSQTNRKVYKIKKQRKNLCYIFEDTESLISASRAFAKEKRSPENSVYLWENKYAVVLENIIEDHSLFAKFREFSCNTLKGKIHTARVKENGKLLADKNGLGIINKYF